MAVLHWGKWETSASLYTAPARPKKQRETGDAGSDARGAASGNIYKAPRTADGYHSTQAKNMLVPDHRVRQASRPQSLDWTRERGIVCASLPDPIASPIQSIFSLFLSSSPHRPLPSKPRAHHSFNLHLRLLSFDSSFCLSAPFCLSCGRPQFSLYPQRTSHHGAPADSTAPRGCPGPSRPQTPHCSSQKSLRADSFDEHVFFAWK